jgi:hypothetical protein
MTQQHPITPPPELVQQWLNEEAGSGLFAEPLAAKAAQWGADQELDACCEWVSQWRCLVGGSRPEVGLRAARRPEPPSLKEQALEALAHILNNSSTQLGADTIRRALEQLDD